MPTRVYISCDLEGISGVISRDQAGSQGRDYERTRKAMTADVNAAIEGALAAGAGLVVVNDGHGPMTNLLLDEVHPAAEVILGTPKPLTQMEGIDGGFDVALFVGYHARQGSAGILSHTISGGTIAGIWVNGTLVGETGINAVLAGHYGVPVGLVTGDQHLAAEARALLPWVHTVEVKQAITRYSARCLHPQRARGLIRAGAEAAVAAVGAKTGAGQLKPLVVGKPVVFRVAFKDSGMADAAIRVPGALMIDAATLEYSGPDAANAFIAMRGMIGLAQGA